MALTPAPPLAHIRGRTGVKKTERIWSPSQLTVSRPDIWQRALVLCTDTTGVTYVEKRPLPDGSVFACGGGYLPQWHPEPPIADRIERQRERVEKMERNRYDHSQREIDRAKAELDDLLKELPDPEKRQTVAVYVPSGAMEWLLHEVGHWVAASDADRRRPNYGAAEDYEVAAWAFEEAVLSRFGPARLFAPPTQRDGQAFTSGPIASSAFRRIDQRLADGRIDIEPFRSLWSEWVAWGALEGEDAPWRQARTGHHA